MDGSSDERPLRDVWWTEQERPFGRARLWACPTTRFASNRSGLDSVDRGRGRAVSLVGSTFGEGGRTPRSPPIRGCVAAQRIIKRDEIVLVLETSSSWTMHNLSAHSLLRDAFDRSVAEAIERV